MTDADRWLPFAPVDLAAPAALLRAVREAGVAHEVRTRRGPDTPGTWPSCGACPCRGRAGDALLRHRRGTAASAARPRPRRPRIGAPRLRQRLGADNCRVLRADRGVGASGWGGLPGAPGALPAVPGLFYARGLIDDAVFDGGGWC